MEVRALGNMSTLLGLGRRVWIINGIHYPTLPGFTMSSQPSQESSPESKPIRKCAWQCIEMLLSTQHLRSSREMRRDATWVVVKVMVPFWVPYS